MANYYAAARSNYFAVRDRAALERALERFDITVVVDGADGTVALLCQTEDGWPAGVFDEHDEWIEIDLFALVAEHLVPGHVAVFLETGAEKLRYLHGAAVAINHAGERRTLTLDGIYARAAQLGEHVTAAES